MQRSKKNALAIKMAEKRDDGAELPLPTNPSSFTDEDRACVKGCGCTPLNNNNNHNLVDNDREKNGFEGGGGDCSNNRNSDDDGQLQGRSGRSGSQGEGRKDFRNSDDNGNRGSSGFSGRGDFDNKFGGGGDGDDDTRLFCDCGGRDGESVSGLRRSGCDDGEGDGNNGWNDDGGEGRGKDGENSKKPPPVISPKISTDDIEIFHQVGGNFNFWNIIGKNAFPGPIETFKEMGLRTLVLDNIAKSGYTKPTVVQKYAIPIIMAGRDLVVCAQTNSEKIAAFMIPIVSTLLERPSELKLISGGCEPHCIVVAPTRKLAENIWRQALKFSKDSVIKCTVIYGGVATMHQGNQVADGCHILVATPGRLLDFVDRRRVSFASVRYIVLEEADRMLDMGFLETMRKMMDHETMVAKGERQILMFSATFGEQVQNIARDFLHDCLFLKVGIHSGAFTDVEQFFHNVTNNEKQVKLMELLKCETVNSLPKTLIFVEMKKTADFVAAMLSEKNISATSMHGDKMQQQRKEALMNFKSGKIPILVVTAVADRSLDNMDVAHVINYDMPKEIDEYVYRISKTRRVGNCGKVTSLFNFQTDSAIVGDLVNILRAFGQIVPDSLLAEGVSPAARCRKKFGGYDRNFGNDTECDAESEEE